MFKMKTRLQRMSCAVAVTLAALVATAGAQDRIRIELNMGQERPRLAAPDFKAANADAQTAPLNTVFNQTLWNDLDNAGIFDMVARSFYPLQSPGSPNELQAAVWGNPPPNAG